MPWILTEHDDLVNLDHVANIRLKSIPAEGNNGKEFHALVARYAGDKAGFANIMVGTKDDCKTYLDDLASQLTDPIPF